jgi:hypothetical protein
MIATPFRLKDGGRLAPIIAIDLVARLVIIMNFRRFLSMGATSHRTLCSESYARMKEFARRYTHFRRCLGDVRGEPMLRLFMVLHGTLGSYLRDALHEDCVDAVTCVLAQTA